MDYFDSIQAIVIKDADNVATAIVDLKKGDIFIVESEGTGARVEIAQDINSGHKFAVCDTKKGAQIIKYGEVIGVATTDIKRGEHVHIHNVESQRGRGDISGK